MYYIINSLKCKICGIRENLPFECTYCKNSFCYIHRLPHNHDCIFLNLYHKKEISHKQGFLKDNHISLANVKNLVYFSKLKSSHIEILHLSLATFLVMLVGLSLNGYRHISWHFLVIFISAFLVHELAHKFLAQYYKGWAEFRLDVSGLFITAFSAIPMNPFKFIAPGAVRVRVSTSNQFGKVAIIGPLTNLVMGFSFFIVHNFVYSSPYFYTGATFNAWIALFNLIPFGVLDGQKIFRWNKIYWTIMMACSMGLFILPSVF
ncbi:MAG: hypothetical protein DA328_08215 [Nitrososphaeraceae archaeon]|nr:hypothetical protein [Nitrososphaeraceae archaeon]